MFNATDLTPMVRSLTDFPSDLNLKYNIFTDLTSATTGMLFKKIERSVEEHFAKDSFKLGNTMMGNMVFQYIGESGKINKTSKLNKLFEFFGMEDIDDRVGGSQYSRIFRAADKSGFAMSKLANMPIQPSILGAALHDYRLYDGKILNFKTFQERKKVDAANNGETYNAKDARTEWKNLEKESFFHMLDLDQQTIEPNDKFKEYVRGKYGEVSDEIIYKEFLDMRYKIGAKAVTVLKRIDGLLNPTDPLMLQRNVIGSLTTLHKGWLFLFLGNRFKNKQVNLMTSQVEEGHYRTAMKTLNNIRKELRKTGFNPVEAFKNVKGEMTLEEYKNFKRVGVEFATLMLMYR